MQTHNLHQRHSRLRQSIGRYAGRIVLLLLLAAITGALYRSGGLPKASALQPSASGAAAHDPAMQSFLGYLRAHTGSAPAPAPAITPADPAQQAVMGYLRAHAPPTPEPVSPWDAAVQAVRDYLQIHSR